MTFLVSFGNPRKEATVTIRVEADSKDDAIRKAQQFCGHSKKPNSVALVASK